MNIRYQFRVELFGAGEVQDKVSIVVRIFSFVTEQTSTVTLSSIKRSHIPAFSRTRENLHQGAITKKGGDKIKLEL